MLNCLISQHMGVAAVGLNLLISGEINCARVGAQPQASARMRLGDSVHGQ